MGSYHIPTKSSAATAILSKRWNRVWSSVPNLDFGLYVQSTYESPVKKSQFFDFVDRVLSLNNVVSVRKVHLSCYYTDCEPARAAACMTSFCLRDCEEFHVRLPGPLSYSMPNSFFTKYNLVKLKLVNVVLKAPPLVCFPRLKTIHCEDVEFPDDDTMKNLTSGCPVLTHLTIIDGISGKVSTLYIFSSTLNYLQLCPSDSGHDVVIDAPKLTDLDILDVARLNNVIINVPSLVHVDLDISVQGQDGFEEKLFGLFRKISHVSELFLTSGIMVSLEHVDLENLPIFKNLTKLDMLLDVDCSSWGLAYLFGFTQTNLVKLTLQYVVLNLPPLVCFPRLKTIHFDSVQFPEDDTMKNLMSGCPVLTHLTIRGGIFSKVFTLYIFSPTLNYLRLHPRYSRHDVVIDAPNLTDLVIFDVPGVNYVILDVSSLVRVDLDITDEEQGYEEKLFGLFRKISHVSELVLTSVIMISLEHVDLENLPIFKNLTKLKVLSVVDYSSWWLTYLFGCAPNLVTFIVQLAHDTHFAWYEPNDVPRCFLGSLEHVIIIVVEEYEEEIKMVSYILKNAMVLKKLTINFVEVNLVQETNIRTRLTALPRSSHACQVEYTSSQVFGS